MAKGLPYFQFETSEWENGNIQMCTREEKGLFIDICSMYWSRLGDLPYKLVLQKLCAGNATALRSLCDSNIIVEIEGNLSIKFLDIQLEDRGAVSKKNSKIAKDAWAKRKKDKGFDANALRTQSERNTNAIPIEENRIEKNKYNLTEEEIYLESKKNWEEIVTPSKWLDALIKNNFTTKEFLIARLKEFWVIANYLENPDRKQSKDIKLHFANWLKTNPPKKAEVSLSNNPAPWANFGKHEEV